MYSRNDQTVRRDRTVVRVAAVALSARVTGPGARVRFWVAFSVTGAVDVYAGASVELTELKIITNQII